jgi:hypothetical protein
MRARNSRHRADSRGQASGCLFVERWAAFCGGQRDRGLIEDVGLPAQELSTGGTSGRCCKKSTL